MNPRKAGEVGKRKDKSRMAGIDQDALWEAMKRADKSPADLADEVGCSVSTISAWIGGTATPRQAVLRSLARVLRVRPETLLQERE
jgi:transcriptional regulator with XRE-family HTH domain